MNDLVEFYTGPYLEWEVENVPKDATMYQRRHFLYLRLKAGQYASYCDVGCSQGYMLGIAKGLVPKVIGVDISLPLLRNARAATQAPVCMGSGDSLPFPSQSFDVVSCFQVLEHIPDYEAAFAELCRICRKRMVVSTDFCSVGNFVDYQALGADRFGHLHIFNRDDFEAMIARHGLKIRSFGFSDVRPAYYEYGSQWLDPLTAPFRIKGKNVNPVAFVTRKLYEYYMRFYRRVLASAMIGRDEDEIDLETPKTLSEKIIARIERTAKSLYDRVGIACEIIYDLEKR